MESTSVCVSIFNMSKIEIIKKFKIVFKNRSNTGDEFIAPYRCKHFQNKQIYNFLLKMVPVTDKTCKMR